MTTDNLGNLGAGDSPLKRMEGNLSRIEDLSKRLVGALSHARAVPQALSGPGPDLMVKAVGAYWADMAANPAKLVTQQVEFWAETVKHYAAAQQAMVGLAAPEDPGPADKRFQNPLWDSNPFFNFVKQQYQMNAAALQRAVQAVEGLEARDQRRLDYFTRQIIDMMAPTNFLMTNPDALEKAVETEGESLVKGLENLVHDIEANGGDLMVTLADKEAFTVGGNIATTPGDVVFRNRLFELIQYRPATEQVHEIPVVIFPPWINKFYILDLKPQNSFIKWLVEQGYTVFVLSWVNPGADLGGTSLSDYVQDGYLAAIREVKAICGGEQVSAVGWCIAGTTLSLALGLMAQRGDRSVASATFLTTLTDFSDQGEFSVFLDNDFVDGIEAECKASGILDKFYMSRTFSFLRSNDLIYQPAIRSYMLGQTPPAFDLLYWNGDGTNLPGVMAVEYLRGLCQGNALAGEGFPIAGTVVRLSDVTLPLCAIACETDHIANWAQSLRGVQGMGSDDKTFILSESGHIAGIVNPPSKGKYGHWTNPDLSGTPDDWLKGAVKQTGSWWPRWEAWLAPRSGIKVAARQPGDSGRAVLAPAPGTYVTQAP
jgi:polyhydroxyalkanoate synthase subunit PhaC